MDASEIAAALCPANIELWRDECLACLEEHDRQFAALDASVRAIMAPMFAAEIAATEATVRVLSAALAIHPQ